MPQNAPELISEHLKFQKFSGRGDPLQGVHFTHIAWPDHSYLACSGPGSIPSLREHALTILSCASVMFNTLIILLG